MAEIVLSNAIFYKAGSSGVSAIVGYESGTTRVARYTLVSPATGASHVALQFNNNLPFGDGTVPETLRFYIGTSETSHANAGASSEYTGTLTYTKVYTEYNYSGEADIVLLPNTTYYVWLFPASTATKYLQWNTAPGAATATATGGAISVLTCGNGTLGKSQILTVTKYADSFTHTITYECGTASGTIADKSASTSIAWTPPLSLASQNTTGTVMRVDVTIQTYSGSTAIGEPVTTTVTMVIPDSVKPSCSLGVSDYMGYADTYGAYIKGLSRFSIAVVPSASYGAEVVSCKITANGTTYDGFNVVTDAIASTAHTTITAEVKDSRGRSSTIVSKVVSILDYNPPTIASMTAYRCNANGTENEDGNCIKVTFSAHITPLNNKNSGEYFIHWKKSGAVDYEGSYAADDLYGDIVVSNYSYIISGADTTASYEVMVTVEDNHLGRVRTAIVATSFALMHFRADGTGMAIGKLSEKADSFEVGLPIYDRFGTAIGAGLAEYTGSGNNAIDANTTLEQLVLTNKNTPTDAFFYVWTNFYNTKSTTANRGQLAIPYNSEGAIHFRYYYNGTWSNWRKPYYGGEEAVFAKIELHRASPYIDFHYNNSTADFTQRIMASSGGLCLYGATSNYVAVMSDRFRSSANDTHYLGDATYKWKAVYAVNGTIQTSDRNQKRNIEQLDERYIALFDKLQPVSFMFNDAESDRVHIGFISQDVKAAMDEVGLSDLDFAGFCRDIAKETVEVEDPETGEISYEEREVRDANGNPVFLYSLRYSEFIALNSRIIQLNRQRLAEQAQEIQALRGELDSLKSIVAGLVNQREGQTEE
jgi:hypothetical protein